MEIDWSKVPEGTTHAGIFDGEIYWCKIADGGMYAGMTAEVGGEVLGGTANQWKEKFDYIEKPTTATTIQQLRSLVQQSGLQIEFHADGTIYVWDDAHEEGTRVNSLDEYIRLAEAKAVYVKLWSDYIWE